MIENDYQNGGALYPMRDIASPDLTPELSMAFGLMESAYTKLTALVQGMSEEELHFTGPAGNINSTAMLIRHLAYADLGYFYMIKDERIPPELEAEYGPFETEEGTLPSATGQSLEQLLQRYRRVLNMMHEYLKTQTDADARRAVRVPWWPQPATVRYVLWHLASHSTFHQGQIARLRAQFTTDFAD